MHPIASVIISLVCLFSAGCGIVELPARPVAERIPADLAPSVGGDARANLERGTLLAALAYGASADQAPHEQPPYTGVAAGADGLSVGARLDAFALAGLPSAYVAPRHPVVAWVRYPELYVVGNRADQSVAVVFVGTNDLADWYQNAKTGSRHDEDGPGLPLIPPGHAGYRRAVMRLADAGFAERLLPDLCASWGIRPGPDGTIPLFVAGHSMGAGIAQLSLPSLEGFRHIGHGGDADGFHRVERVAPRFTVRGVYLVAPPYALASDTWFPDGMDEDVRRLHRAAYRWMSNRYADIMYNIIHDADAVCDIYDVRGGHAVSFKHLGRLVRIDGLGRARLEPTAWLNDRPHDQWGYLRAVHAMPADALAPATVPASPPRR